MAARDNMLCSKSHEYVFEADGNYYIGLTDYAIEQLGDIVFVELPEVGSSYTKGEIFGTMTPLKGLTWVYNTIYLNEANDNNINEMKVNFFSIIYYIVNYKLLTVNCQLLIVNCKLYITFPSLGSASHHLLSALFSLTPSYRNGRRDLP